MATNNGNVPRSMNADGSVTSKAQSADRGDRDIEMIRQVVVDEYVAPPIPNKTVPIRAEAKVMRIWIAPWQDGSGDLHISSYVYTEVEPRKWLFDNQGSARAIHLEPLQTLPAPEQPDGRRN